VQRYSIQDSEYQWHGNAVRVALNYKICIIILFDKNKNFIRQTPQKYRKIDVDDHHINLKND